jgi:hypothetical protein
VVQPTNVTRARAFANTLGGSSGVALKLKSTGRERAIIMRALRFISCITLTFVAAAGAASPVWPQTPRLVPQVPQIFEDYTSLYARIVADQRLGSPYDEGLVRNLQAHSSVEHFPDRSANPIAVVKVELLNDDGSSRMRSKYGNYPFLCGPSERLSSVGEYVWPHLSVRRESRKAGILCRGAPLHRHGRANALSR